MAATLYKWIDEDGNVVYQDTPPPNNVEFEESEVQGLPDPLSDQVGQQIEEAARSNPVSLYTVPVCDSCDLVRLYLERNSIPFAEKDVRNNVETQAELQDLTGALSVPTLVIGNRTLDGFSRAAIKSALVDAGFPIGEPETNSTENQVSEQQQSVEDDSQPEEDVLAEESSEEDASDGEFDEDQDEDQDETSN